MFEMSINLKSFCNNYHLFYYSGHVGRAFKLIRAKTLVGQVSFSLPIKNTNHCLDFQVTT